MNSASFNIVIELSPLWELRYTGVPNVAYELLHHTFNNRDFSFYYICAGHVLKRDTLHRVLEDRNGAAIREQLGGGLTVSEQYAEIKHGFTIYTNTKVVPCATELQGQIIYDLSFYSFSEFHTKDNILHHTKNFEQDISSNAINFCISDATAYELCALTGISSSKCLTIPLGLSSEGLSFPLNRRQRIFESHSKYFLFLSTLEPRKNLDILLESVSTSPAMLKDHILLVVGRDGWNTTWDELVFKYNCQELVELGRIRRINYVTERQKYQLLKGASALIYPSFYEGFGLPVLEACRSRIPVILSVASSIPEVGGASAIYFDPFSLSSFKKAIHQYFYELETGALYDRVEQCYLHSFQFSYEAMANRILEAVSNEYYRSRRAAK